MRNSHLRAVYLLFKFCMECSGSITTSDIEKLQLGTKDWFIDSGELQKQNQYPEVTSVRQSLSEYSEMRRVLI